MFLGVDCENLNELTGKVMSAFEQYLHEFPTDAVIVVDDLASTMAVSIVTKKRGILLAHIAAGTRSFDITMPKEINRLVIDGLSDILFTAGLSNNSIANKEGAELSKVYMVGNILIDNIRFLQAFMHRSQLMEDMQLQDKQYLVFTLNRKAIIENHEKLFAMLEAVVNNAGHLPVIAPLRDLAKEIVESIAAEKQLDMSHFHIVEPQGISTSVILQLMQRALLPIVAMWQRKLLLTKCLVLRLMIIQSTLKLLRLVLMSLWVRMQIYWLLL